MANFDWINASIHGQTVAIRCPASSSLDWHSLWTLATAYGELSQQLCQYSLKRSQPSPSSHGRRYKAAKSGRDADDGVDLHRTCVPGDRPGSSQRPSKTQITFRPHSDVLGHLTSPKTGLNVLRSRRQRSKRGQTIHATPDPTGWPTDRLESGGQLSPCSRSSDRVKVARLPPEILYQIFQLLDVQSRGRAAQVCRSWRSLLEDKTIWKGSRIRLYLNRQHASSGDSSYIYPSMARRGIDQVQVMSVRRSLREVTNGLANIHTLNLSGCHNLCESALENAFTREMPSLRRLDLSLCKEIGDPSIGRISSYCPNVVYLNLAGCTRITNSALVLISWGLKKLDQLNLRSCRHLTDVGIGRLAGFDSPTGKYFELSNLTHLSIQDCQRLTDDSLRHIASGLPRLASINLSFCLGITDAGIRDLGRLAKLHSVNLRACENISDAAIQFLANHAQAEMAAKQPSTESACTFLTHLDVSFCTNLTEAGIRHLVSGNRISRDSLQILSMANVGVTDDVLIQLLRRVRCSLQTLNIGQCERLTDKSVEEICSICSTGPLRYVDLYGCKSVSHQMVARLVDLSRTSGEDRLSSKCDFNLKLAT